MKYVAAMVVALVARVGIADAPALETQTTDAFTIGTPKGWKVTTQPGTPTLVVAQQDPTRKDAAAMLFTVQLSGATATDDNLLDAVAAQFPGMKVSKREAIPGGGKYLIGDTATDSLKVRVSAAVVAINGAALMGVLVAKPNDSDALGGVALIMKAIGSIKVTKPPAPARTTTTAPAAATPASGDKLDTPPSRALTAADFTGTWEEDSGSIKGYVNSTTGTYAGYSSVSTASTYTISDKGHVTTKLRGVQSSTGGAGFVSQNYEGDFIVSPNGVIEITNKGHTSTFYVVKGWYQTPELTVVKLAGQFWGKAPPESIADPSKGNHEIWVRKNKK